MLIPLVEIGCLVAGVQTTLRFTSYAGGYRTRPSDTPASESYAPRLDGCSFGYPIGGGGGDTKVRLGDGQITIGNVDGRYDAMLDYVYDGQVARLLMVQHTAAYSTAVEYGRWTLEQPSDGDASITLITRSPTYGLERSLQEFRFTGAGGVTGGAELANKPQPLAWGPMINARAILVDATANIYMLLVAHRLHSVTADTVIDDVFDEGVALSRGADYASVADMIANVPTGADDYRVCNATAATATYNWAVFVRLQSDALGEITWNGEGIPYADGFADPTQTATALKGIVAQVATGATISAVDLGLVAARFPYKISLSYGSDGEPATYLDAIRQILTGMRGWLVAYQGFSPVRYAVRWLMAPSDAIISYTTLPLDGSRIATGSFKRAAPYDFGWPEFRTTLQYDRVQYVQTAGLAASVTPAERARLALEYLSVASEDASVKTSYPTAVDRVITTAWSSESASALAVQDEADAQLDVFKDPHPTFAIAGRGALSNVPFRVPGDPLVVSNHPRFGCDVSRAFLILGIIVDFCSIDTDGLIGFTATMMG
jgi:hypothetical protein